MLNLKEELEKFNPSNLKLLQRSLNILLLRPQSPWQREHRIEQPQHHPS